MDANNLKVLLSGIEIENFKSYKGTVTINPISSFSAIIGNNGSGKSNFMDAISFVMGEKPQNLRAKRLRDLIYSSKNISADITASVTATIKFLNGEEKKFQRSINMDSSKYYINGERETAEGYLGQLKLLGINIKSKNFLVFQGTVESISMKSSKELTLLIEEVSGSILLKDKYEKCKTLKEQADEKVKLLLRKKKAIGSDNKVALGEKAEAEKYKQHQENLTNKRIKLHVFRLYHIEREIKQSEIELITKQNECQQSELLKKNANEALKSKRKEQGKSNRGIQKIEQDIRELEVNISKERTTFIKAKECFSHTHKKLESARKTLEQARKANEAHQSDIRKLEDERAKVETSYTEYENTIAGELLIQGKDMKLEEAKVQEYERLKEEAQKKSTKYSQQLGSVVRDQINDQDSLDYEIRKKADIENEYKHLERKIAEAEKRVEKISEQIKITEDALRDQVIHYEDLKRNVDSSNELIEELQSELKSIVEKVRDCKMENYKILKKEVIERLKQEVPGVYDRLVNLCQPIHMRYNVAVTKVLSKKMESIVVDTEKTAQKCIKLLREQKLEFETFLPLDYIQAKIIKEKLRNIQDPKNVKLLYDVLSFEPQIIKKAVLFATNNALVCETQEDAMKVAYNLDGKNKYDAVSLDGTYYQKSGLISGGSVNLEIRARRWDEKHFTELKLKKDKITEKLRETVKTTRKESELIALTCQIKGLENRLRYLKKDMDTTREQIVPWKSQMEQFAKEIELFIPKTEAISKAMTEREHKIQEIKQKINNVEDIVFAQFCQQIGIDNIRQYEKTELCSQQEHTKRKMQFEEQIDRITSNLEFQKSRDTHKNIQRWEHTIQEYENELEINRSAEIQQKQIVDELKMKIDVLNERKQEIQRANDILESELNQAHLEGVRLNRNAMTAQKSLLSTEAALVNKKNERHKVLMQCKIESIALPLLDGQLDDIAELDISVQNSDHNTSGRASSSLNTSVLYERESRIRIDFASLSRAHMSMVDLDEIKNTANEMADSVNNLEQVISRIKTPNLNASQKLEGARALVQIVNREFDEVRRNASKATEDFDKVSKKRQDKFMQCFNRISSQINNIYKKLTKESSAQAHIDLENPDQPYLDGLNYSVVAPGKRFQLMSNLSGGEKTIAALALLFAIHSYNPAPFFVLDEIDAALDNTNVNNVLDYIKDSKKDLQTIVISLKEEFYYCADCIIGIVPEDSDALVSNVLVLHSSDYPEELF